MMSGFCWLPLKNTEQLYEQAEKLHKQLNRYACGPPQIHFTDEDVDHARAAGVLIEFDAGHSRYSPTTCSAPLLRAARAERSPRRADTHGGGRARAHV